MTIGVYNGVYINGTYTSIPIHHTAYLMDIRNDTINRRSYVAFNRRSGKSVSTTALITAYMKSIDILQLAVL